LCYTFYGESMNKIVGRVLVCLYLSFVVILSLYLFMYSHFGTSSIGKYVVFCSFNLKTFNDGSLIVLKHEKENLDIGDNILFYNVYTTKRGVLEQKIKSKEELNDKEITYELDNNRFVSSSYVIGNSKRAISIPILGYVFKILSSSIGYLFFALIPTLIMFVFQVYIIFKKYNF